MTERTEDDPYRRLDQSIGFLLRIAQLKTYERLFRAAGDRPFKPGETTVLWMIQEHPGIRQRQVAQRLMIKPAHMTKMIRSLEDQGLVHRRIPNDDRRTIELTLTEKGVRHTAALESWFADLDRTVSEPLPADELAELKVLLRKLITHPS